MSSRGPSDCDLCGGPLGADPIALAAVHVDDAGDEVDADLAFCSAEHRDAWVAAHRPSATSEHAGGDAPWRTGPAAGERGATAKAVLLLAAGVVAGVLLAWALGRLLA